MKRSQGGRTWGHQSLTYPSSCPLSLLYQVKDGAGSTGPLVGGALSRASGWRSLAWASGWRSLSWACFRSAAAWGASSLSTRTNNGGSSWKSTKGRGKRRNELATNNPEHRIWTQTSGRLLRKRRLQDHVSQSSASWCTLQYCTPGGVLCCTIVYSTVQDTMAEP